MEKISSAQQENNSQPKEKETMFYKVCYIILFSVAVFSLEVVVRKPFTHISDNLQERLNFPFKCQLGDYFVWFKYKGKAAIFLFVFNISNIFVSLSLIALDSFGIFITGTIKLIYLDPRPFWRNEKLIPCSCATNYGSPSTTGLDIYLVCIVVYRALINRSNNKWWKLMVYCFFFIPQILAWASRFMQNLHSLHQLTFGVFCGYIIQYIYFEILEIDMNNVDQLKKLVNTPALMLTLFVSTLSWFLFNAWHYYYIHVNESAAIISTIEKYCSVNIPFYLFDNESYEKTAKAFLFMGGIAGIYFEYSIIFEYNFDKYSTYNMGENRWTETDKYKTILRMLVMFVLQPTILRYTKWGRIKTGDVFDLNFSKCIFKNFCRGFFYFYFIKFVFRFLTLTNEKSNATGDYWSISNDDDEKGAPLILNKKNEVADL